MIEYEAIDDDGKLARYGKRLRERGVRALAMDFEGDFNLHGYGCKLCLVQVYDGTGCAAIDPFRVSADALKRFLEDRGVVKYFYGADSDRSLVRKQYGIELKSVFDLKDAVDALGLERKGLDAVLESVLGIVVEGKKKYQMHNWTLRPVDPRAVEYALSDVRHLFDLARALLARVGAEGKVEELALRLARDDKEPDAEPVPGIKKTREYDALKAHEKRRFQKIWELREKLAEELDLPPNLLVPKELMFPLSRGAEHLPKLQPGRRVPRGAAERLVAGVRAIYADEAPERPRGE